MDSTSKGALMEAATNTIATRPAAITPRDTVAPTDARALPQLGLRGIIAVWAAAALPMALLAWVVAPLLADQLSGSASLPRALIITLTGGVIWQRVLLLILVGREQGTLRPSVLRDALWLRAPRSSRTGRRGGRIWLIVLPLIVAFGVEELLPGPGIPVGRDMGDFLASHAGHTLL